MPSLAQGLAAVIASSTSGECDPDTQLLTFPGFFFPVTADALNGGVEPAAFDFTHRVNMIPGKSPQFMMSGRFVWKVYKAVLERHELPPNADPQAGYANRFARAEAEMGDGLLSNTENTFFPVGVVPSDLGADANWTKIALSGAAIVEAAEDLSDTEARVMERFNTLAELGDQLVASITYDRTTLVILRPWFDPSILAERFWDLPATVISDGGDPPTGELPAVIGKLILIRNLQIHLPAQTLPDVGSGVIYRRLDGTAPEAEALSAPLTRLAVAEQPPVMLAHPLRADAGTVEQQVASVQGAAAEQLGLDSSGAPSGAQKFHVPLRFETARAMGATAAELARAQADRDAKAAAVAEAKSRIAEMEQALAQLSHRSTSAGPFGSVGFPNPAKMKLEMDLSVLKAMLPQAEDELARAEHDLKRWQNSVKVLEQLAAFPEDSTPYVMAIVCDRIPKSPNPDPALFA